MADVIHVTPGLAPWEPSADAVLVKQYHYYDMPLTGVIEQHGVRFLFHCIDGEQEPLNLWSYTRVSPEDEAAIESATPETFTSAIDLPGPIVIAYALDQLGILVSQVVDVVSEEGVRAAKDALIAQLEEWVVAAKGLASV